MADTPIGPLLPFGVLDGAYGFGRSTARTPAREIVKPFPEVTVQVTPVVMDWHRNGPSPVAPPSAALGRMPPAPAPIPRRPRER